MAGNHGFVKRQGFEAGNNLYNVSSDSFLHTAPIKSGREPVGKAPYSCPDEGHRGNGKILNTGSRHFEGRDPLGQRYRQLDSCSPVGKITKSVL